MLFDAEKSNKLGMDLCYERYADQVNYFKDVSYINDDEVLKVVGNYVKRWF